MDSPVLPHIRAVRVGWHTAIAHIFLILNVENHGSVRRVGHIDDSHLEGHGAVVETRCSGSLPVECQLVGVVKFQLRCDEIVLARTDTIVVTFIVSRRIAVSVIVTTHRTVGSTVFRNGPSVALVRACVAGHRSPTVGHLRGRHI